ncbi:Nitrilase and fragile histidine triad fusion protein NitFhit, partial [Stegodyphus mimosarum]
MSLVLFSAYHLSSFRNCNRVLLQAAKRYRNLFRNLTMSSSDSLVVAVCQLNSTADRNKNFEICKNFINVASSRQAKMIFFPECFDHVGESKEQSVQLAETLNGPLLAQYKQLAQEKSIWLSLGGFHEKSSNADEKRVYNSHIIINSAGEIVSVYRKIHLFDIDVAGGVRLRESDYTIQGREILPPINTPVGKVGLGICYDLRFPEFSLSLTKAGAEILTYPSAFTQTTGMAHWEPLLRSRAIESQCYVIAAAQSGRHNAKRSSYGHAMVVDPWGCVIASCSEGIGIVFAEIKPAYITKIRSEMPVWMHRQEELYGRILLPECKESIPEMYMFGSINLAPEQIFYKTKYSMAFVNKKPVLPGHVLVAPLRRVKRFEDLSQSEVSDLFMNVQFVQKTIELEYNASSSTIAIQDGPDAGQSIPHVHVHILPRRPGDFKRNDDIYHQLQEHDKSEDGKYRSPEEMAEEANRLRKHFPNF